MPTPAYEDTLLWLKVMGRYFVRLRLTICRSGDVLSEFWRINSEEGQVQHLVKPTDFYLVFTKVDEDGVFICPITYRRVSQRSCVDSRCASGDIIDESVYIKLIR